MARITYTDMSGQERTVPIGPDAPVVSIGRATDCTIRSNRKSVSRRHAEFRFSNGQFEIVDLNSSNGTYLIINDERKPVHGREYLTNDDEVWCGDFILKFYEEEAHQGFQGGAPSFGGGGFGQPQFGQPQPQFGQPAQPFGQPQQQQQQHAWQQPQQNGFGQPAFGQPDPGFGVESSFGNEPSFGRDTGAGNEPSFGHDAGATRQSPGYEAEFIDSGADQRLTQERDAYAQLAERQKGEIEDLQARLNELKSRFETQSGELARQGESASDVARLQEELQAATGTMRSMEIELQAARNQLQAARSSESHAQQLEHRLDEVESANARLEHELAAARQQDSGASEDLRAQVEAKSRDIAALEGEVDRLTAALRTAEQRAADEAKQGDQRTREELEALRREAERQKRLVEEFEKRNRELQAQVDTFDSDASELEAQLDELERRRGELESDLQTLGSDLESARAERDTARQELAALRAEGSAAELRVEIDTLKRRLQDGGDLGAEVDRLTAIVKELDGENAALRAELQHASVGGGATANDIATIHERLASLDRIVDAIVRTNLDPLSTVDRIRLQSAIRDTDPKSTLAALLEITSS